MLNDERLLESFEVTAYDRRSAGRSEYVTGPCSLADLALDTCQLLDALGRESSIIIGSSMGGMIAKLDRSVDRAPA